MSKKNIRNALLCAVFAATTITQALAAEEPLRRSKRINAAHNQRWIGPFTIKSASFYYDGGWRVEVQVNENITSVHTSCSASRLKKIFTQWVYSDMNAYHNGLMNSLMSAQAQGKKVNLLIWKGGYCKPNYGEHFAGVQILSD